jgi:hypothetical protein
MDGFEKWLTERIELRNNEMRFERELGDETNAIIDSFLSTELHYTMEKYRAFKRGEKL